MLYRVILSSAARWAASSGLPGTRTVAATGGGGAMRVPVTDRPPPAARPRMPPMDSSSWDMRTAYWSRAVAARPIRVAWLSVAARTGLVADR